jgi:hypothetical protein
VPPSACSKRPRRVDGDERTLVAQVATRAVLVQCTCHQFLARTALAGDEHGDVALAQAPDGAKHVLHGRRLTQHLGHGHLGAALHFLAQTFFHGAAYQFHRLVQVERLGQVFEGTALEGTDGAVQVAEGRHDDDGQAGVAFLHLGQQVDAAAAGHADVADQHLWCIVFQRLQYLTRAGEAARLEVFPCQRLLEHEADGVVVVNDPDRFHAGSVLIRSGQRFRAGESAV